MNEQNIDLVIFGGLGGPSRSKITARALPD